MSDLQPWLFVLNEIAGDNNMCLLAARERPDWIDYAWLNLQLEDLSEAELITYAIGEETERKAIARKYKINPSVNEFYNAAFDGQLTRYFYK